MDAKETTRFTQGKGGEPGQKSVTVNQYNTTAGAKNQGKVDDMLRAALSFAEKGKPVFPCSTADKSPLTPNGFYDASTDPATIKRWWAKDQGAAIGIPTGEKSGWVVIDKDDYKASFDQAGWYSIQEQSGGMPETLTQRTGGRGTQYIFQHPGTPVKCKNGLITGLDIKGDGGYIIVWPSLHPSGNRYKLVKDVPPAPLPAPLLDIINGEKQTPAPPAPRHTYHPGNSTAWAEKALSEEINRVVMAADYTRNDNLNRAAFSLGQIVAGGGLDRGTVESELMAAATAAGLTSKEIPKTIRSGLDAGARSPRKTPEPSYTGAGNQGGTIDPSRTAARAEQILKDRAAPKQFNTAHLPDDFRRYVADICQRTDTDPIIIIMAVLVSIGALLNIRARIPSGVYFSTLYPVLWVLIQDDSGAFKTTGLNKGTRMIWQRVGEIQDLIQVLEAEKEQYGIDQAQKHNEIAARIKQELYASPLMPNKASAEGLLDLMEKGQRGAVLCSEFGEWLMNMSKTHNAGLKALFTELFDVPRQYSYMTRGGGHMIIKRPFISIMGLSTHQWIQENVTLGDVGSGFFARDLIFTPPPKRVIPPALPRVTEPIDRTFEERARARIDSIQDKEFGLTPEAREAFEAVHGGIYEAMDKQCTPEERALLSPYAKRWSPYVLKLALIFQVLDEPRADIGIDAIIPAAAIVEYAMESTIHLFRGDLGLSPFQRNCEAVLKFIAKRGGDIERKDLLSSKTLTGGAKEYDDVLTMLVEGGQINIHIPATGGKKCERITIV
jgi:hypothetical protein